ncbi:MAG TPA: hypothetical protein VGQ46_21370 [Thermoanaerobaculia bacterium]|jgi:hypothetical protein|nr:hypothetical protein [Thermoanaerobaculia bacterium]
MRTTQKPVAPTRSLRIVPHHCLLQPGLDQGGFNHLADELENEVVLSAMKKRSMINTDSSVR